MTWHERIDRAEKRGGFTEEDCDLAGVWVDCACGQQDPRIPRDGDGCPLDGIFMTRGCEFFNYVDLDAFTQARTCLAAIEKRAAEILASLEVGA